MGINTYFYIFGKKVHILIFLLLFNDNKIKNILSNFDIESDAAIEKANSLMQYLFKKRPGTHFCKCLSFDSDNKQLETKNMSLIER